MSDDEIDALMEDYLPKWAICRAHGTLMLGAQLPTKDGRRMGNAHIIGEVEKDVHHYFVVLTDAGSQLIMTEREIAECFYPPEWVSDVSEVLRKFSRN